MARLSPEEIRSQNAGAPPWAASAAVAVLAAALSATGAPTADALAWLGGMGVSAPAGGALLHGAPVAAAVLGVQSMRVVVRGRGPALRAAVYAVAGGAVGFFTAMCLDLFVGVQPAIERLTGPLQDAEGLDVFAWALTALSFWMAAMTAFLAIGGRPAARLMAAPDADPECIDVRARDRRLSAVSAAGLAGQGVFIGALAVAHQLDADTVGTRLAVAGAVAAGVAVFGWCSWVLWRDFDELQRRATVEAYAWSGFSAWLACLVWAVLESFALAPPLSAYGAIIALIGLQTVASVAVAARLSLSGVVAGGRTA